MDQADGFEVVKDESSWFVRGSKHNLSKILGQVVLFEV